MDLVAHTDSLHLPAAPRPALLRAPALRPGDRIRLCAPSYPTTAPRLRQALAALRRNGYRVGAAPNSTQQHGYVAGSDGIRAEELNRALADPGVRLIAAVRGGYGAMRILDRLDFSPLLEHPKLLVGYSDFTAVLLAALARTGLAGFHGPMPAVEMIGAEAAFAFENLARALAPEPMGALPLDAGARVLRPGSGRGPLLGGCLSLLAHLAGTGFLPNLDGAVLFWEEIDEPPYRIDRMLTQLRLGGHLSRLAGLIVGGLTGCEPEAGKPSLSVEQVVLDVMAGTDCPIVFGLPVGHIPRPITVPLGVTVRVEADESGKASLVVEEAATVPARARRRRAGGEKARGSKKARASGGRRGTKKR